MDIYMMIAKKMVELIEEAEIINPDAAKLAELLKEAFEILHLKEPEQE